METILKKFIDLPANTEVLLREFLRALRPSGLEPSAAAARRLLEVNNLLEANDGYREGMGLALARLVQSKRLKSLLTEVGIYSNKSFVAGTFDKVFHFLLPPVPGENQLSDTIDYVFEKSSDHEWVNAIPDEDWGRFFILSRFWTHFPPKEIERLQEEAVESVMILAQRLSAMGFEDEFLRRNPHLTGFNSPFTFQENEIFDYVRQFIPGLKAEPSDLKPVLVMLNQCEELLVKTRNNQQKFGANLNFTYSLVRARQVIERLRLLLDFLESAKTGKANVSSIMLFKKLVKGEKLKYSLSEHFSDNLSLLALQVTEHAGRTGEHYITNTRKEYWGMLRSSMGGGLIVGFLTVFKTLIYYLRLAPFGEAFLYSMNYSLGFITIHLTHSTLATKQPAMTASRIAASLETKQKAGPDIESLSNLIVRTIRSQFIAVVGNAFVALPVAFGISWLVYWFSGEHIATADKAHKFVRELHPINSLSLFHAGIAGFYLFFSGLISGYFDNKNIYSKISQRVEQHPFLKPLIGPRVMGKLRHYLDHNLGSLAGNFFLGIFLGSTATLGMIFGLPLDIRHITFSSGNFGLALAQLGTGISSEDIFFSILGILGIGIINLAVSFGFSIYVAIKSRHVNFRQTRYLIYLLMIKFYNSPASFIYPQKDPEPLESDQNTPNAGKASKQSAQQ